MPLSAEVFLISSIIGNRQLSLATAKGASPEIFHTHTEEFDWIVDYYGKHRKTPSKIAFMRAFPDFSFKKVDDTAHFVQEVKKAHTRQAMTSAMRDAADLLAAGKVTEAADLMGRDIIKIASSMGQIEDVDILHDWKGVYNDVRARKLRFDEFGMAGIPTGFDTLDERTGGVGRGQFWVVGARLGEGKSWTLLKMAISALLNEQRVHFSALEMSRYEVSMRAHNFLSGAVGKKIYKANQLSQGKDFDLREYRKFLQDLPKMIKGSFTVSDTRNIGAMEIAAQIERTQPDIYFLDYLTLAKMRSDGGWQDISNFSKELKTIAGQYDIGMVAAAQLNRDAAGNGREPAGAETLGGSDAIGQDADAVITIKQLSPRTSAAKLVKYRHGRAGYMWYTMMDLDNGIFEEISKNKADDIRDQDNERRDQEMENERNREDSRSTNVIPFRKHKVGSDAAVAYAMPQGAGKHRGVLRRKQPLDYTPVLRRKAK